jgi:hypothetical protein
LVTATDYGEEFDPCEWQEPTDSSSSSAWAACSEGQTSINGFCYFLAPKGNIDSNNPGYVWGDMWDVRTKNIKKNQEMCNNK